MKCPSGTVEVSVWLDKEDSFNPKKRHSIYFDTEKRCATPEKTIDFWCSEDRPGEMLEVLMEKLRPVLQLMSPVDGISSFSTVYILTPEEFEVITEGVENDRNV